MTAETSRPARHPRHGLDDVIHAPIRFSLVTTLSGVERAEFAFVRDSVEISDPALSKRVTVLEQAGYVNVKKGHVGKRPRTWLSLSSAGKAAYASHLAALTEIANAPVRPAGRSPAQRGFCRPYGLDRSPRPKMQRYRSSSSV